MGAGDHRGHQRLEEPTVGDDRVGYFVDDGFGERPRSFDLYLTTGTVQRSFKLPVTHECYVDAYLPSPQQMPR